ncbi:MAG: rod shape-determining protein MreC [Bacteroidetes bacterium]|nr:MAG: rod shape-determining protein MreC [Bacteroidota bacterium]
MRNLILFFQRFYVFFLFLILFVLSLSILVSNNNFQRASFLNASNTVTGTVYDGVSEVRSFFNLSQENERLRAENAELKGILRSSYYVDTITAVEVNDSVFKQQYAFIPAKVVNNSIDKKYNYITLNRGSLHGVRKHQGVISDNGVVGVVIHVSEHYCTVMSVLNRNLKISPKIDSSNYFGTLSWDATSVKYAQLTQINRFAEVEVGQKVLTSGFSTNFPENILIGKIDRVELKEGGNFYDIEVELSTNFANLTTVYIVQNLMKDELNQLDGEREEDEDGN